MHDVGGLLLPADEPQPRIQIIVGNDGGGTIFDGLEVRQSAHEADFARVQTTPQQVDFAQLAAAYGWAHIAVTDRAGLERALTDKATSLIEVTLADVG